MAKGKNAKAFISDILTSDVLDSAEAQRIVSVADALKAARAVIRKNDNKARRDAVVNKAKALVAGSIADAVESYREGKSTKAGAEGKAFSALLSGYRDVMSTGSQHASEDFSSTAVKDFEKSAHKRATEQRPYISAFLDHIVKSLTPASRADVYGATMNGAYNEAYGDTVSDAHPTYKVVWQLGDASGSCGACKGRDGQVFDSVGDLPGYPGDSEFGGFCLGGPNCTCGISFIENDDEEYFEPEQTPQEAADAMLENIPGGMDMAHQAMTRDEVDAEMVDRANARTSTGE
jgi:hypothetical protein